MKIYLSLITLFLTLNLYAQKDWITTTMTTYSVQHPKTWNNDPSPIENELTMMGEVPDVENRSEFIGTTLFIESKKAVFSNMNEAKTAYKRKLNSMDFMENVQIKREKKINFKGVEAVEIIFTADVAKLHAGCRIIIFQHNDLYYEVSVTYDQSLPKPLIKEAFKVIDSFDFVE